MESGFAGLKTIQDFMAMLTTEDAEAVIGRIAKEVEATRKCTACPNVFIDLTKFAEEVMDHYGADDYSVVTQIESSVINSTSVDTGDPDGAWSDLCRYHADKAEK